MSEIKLNLEQIKEYQQNRYPYLFVDYIDKLIPGKISNGYKILSEDEWFFKVHWPGDPNMPGMLQVESLVQVSALALTTLPNNKGKLVYLISADKLKFIKKIIPGSKLILNTKIIEYKRGLAKVEGRAYVDDTLVCSADFRVIMPHELNKFKINK
jgi:3-hydroxyacyl-[acyl-carrier-protein] dehydratase